MRRSVQRFRRGPERQGTPPRYIVAVGALRSTAIGAEDSNRCRRFHREPSASSAADVGISSLSSPAGNAAIDASSTVDQHSTTSPSAVGAMMRYLGVGVAGRGTGRRAASSGLPSAVARLARCGSIRRCGAAYRRIVHGLERRRDRADRRHHQGSSRGVGREHYRYRLGVLGRGTGAATATTALAAEEDAAPFLTLAVTTAWR